MVDEKTFKTWEFGMYHNNVDLYKSDTKNINFA